MAIISGGHVIEGSVGPILNAGAPAAGTSEVLTVTVSGTPSGGTYRLRKDGLRTAAIAYDAAASAVQAALQAVPSYGSGNVQVTGSAGGPYTVTASGELAQRALSNLVLDTNSLTGGTNPTVQIVETTPGVNATAQGAGKGARLIDTTNGKEYTNTGTGTVPVWTVTGTQT